MVSKVVSAFDRCPKQASGSVDVKVCRGMIALRLEVIDNEAVRAGAEIWRAVKDRATVVDKTGEVVSGVESCTWLFCLARCLVGCCR